MFFLLFLLAGIGITNLVVNATLLEKPRNFLIANSYFFGMLVSCMMCTGFWVGFILGIHAHINPIYMGGAISFLSYIFGELIEYLQVASAARANELSDVVDGEDEDDNE